MRKEDQKEAKEDKSIKNLLFKKKYVITAFIIFIFLVVIITAIFKFKYDENGAILPKHNNSSTKMWNDDFNSVRPTSDGGYVAAGCATDRDLDNSPYVEGKYKEDAIIAKYNEKGKIIWKKYLNSKENDEYYSVKQTSDGEYIVVGFVGKWHDPSLEPELFDGIIAKYSASGKLIWDKKYGTSSTDEIFFNVSQTGDDGYVVVGGKILTLLL